MGAQRSWYDNLSVFKKIISLNEPSLVVSLYWHSKHDWSDLERTSQWCWKALRYSFATWLVQWRRSNWAILPVLLVDQNGGWQVLYSSTNSIEYLPHVSFPWSSMHFLLKCANIRIKEKLTCQRLISFWTGGRQNEGVCYFK